MIKMLSLSLQLTVLGGASAFAELTTYHCTFPQKAQSGAIPPDLMIAYDKAKGTVTAYDGIIKAYNKEPVKGRVAVDNAKRVTFAWDLKKTTNSTSQFAVALQYRATIQKSNLKVALSMVPVGYSNTFRGDGNCVLK